MATLADSLVSSSARRLALRKRPDLSAERQRYQGTIYWVVKEPVGLNYFRFHEEEYFILCQLDGNTSFDEIKRRFEKEFPPEKIRLEELQQFVGTLHRSGLVIADVPDQGPRLLKRRRERRRQEIIGALSNVLAFRFKGIDPERILNFLEPCFRWVFTRWAFTLWLMLALSAVSLILVQFDVFQSKLPTFYDFFTVKNAIWLAVVMGITKVIHEFGHGLSCKHYGGECHEMGVMLLVLTPCLYCNVSDSWMLPNKWHRVAIGAAGMYVEVFLASVATFLWWFSDSTTMFNQLCLSTMFVCSVSTVLLNGNPLLRYDGYYILSDVLEIPNLRQKASAILTRKLGEWCLGLEPPDDPFLPQRNQLMFAAYSIASVIYRWMVLFSILWFLNKMFEPYGLKAVGQVIAASAMYGLVVHPFVKLWQYFRVPGRLAQVKKLRLFVSACVVVTVVTGVLMLPLPYHVICTLEIKPREAHQVYVNVPGTLDEVFVESGQTVTPDEQLARLSDFELQRSVVELEGQEAVYNERIRTTEKHSHDDPDYRSKIGELQEELHTTREMLSQRRKNLSDLTLRAPVAGVVIPPPYQSEQPDDDGRLTGWYGTPLESRNRGATLAQRTLFCQIGDPTKWKAELVIDQADITFVEPGQRVEIMLEELPGEVLESTVSDVGSREIQYSSRSLSAKAGGDLATRTDPTGGERPLSASFPAMAPLDDSDGLLRPGLRGTGKIHAGTMTVGRRLYRAALRTFHFSL
ncbi:MAG: hemolysin D [Pirellulales bacterium]|nr:HlyD family efflux transporter periplasmic adaptor subunit [Planctomycetales bacterium]